MSYRDAVLSSFFFFNDTATTEIYTLSLHDALPIWTVEHGARGGDEVNIPQPGRNYGWPIISYGVDYSGAKIGEGTAKPGLDRKSTRLNSSHANISYAVFCLKKKKKR